MKGFIINIHAYFGAIYPDETITKISEDIIHNDLLGIYVETDYSEKHNYKYFYAYAFTGENYKSALVESSMQIISTKIIG